MRSACRTVAQLPSIGEYGRSYSCLGGWNLMIGDNSPNPTAAWEFIGFAADADRQKQRALEGGFLPTVSSLYDDAEIAEAVPVVEAGRQALENARVRPVSPVYSRVSPRIARTFQRVLRGDLTGEEAVETLQAELADHPAPLPLISGARPRRAARRGSGP